MNTVSEKEFWRNVKDEGQIPIATPMPVPREVAKCPECGTKLWWQLTTSDGLRDLNLDCFYDSYKNPHRNWQGEWEPVFNQVRQWLRKKLAEAGVEDQQIAKPSRGTMSNAAEPSVALAHPNVKLSPREALSHIIKLCEDYQNADIEGHDPDQILSGADRAINLICKLACEGAAIESQIRYVAVGKTYILTGPDSTDPRIVTKVLTGEETVKEVVAWADKLVERPTNVTITYAL